MFAIALTLLVLDLRIPGLGGDPGRPRAMLEALGEVVPALVAYGVAFLLLGRYWLAHHAFTSRLSAVDRGLLGRTLVYLAFVALLPFPSSLVGSFEENPISVVVFALVLAAISGMETVMFVHAHRAGLFAEPLTDQQFRWSVGASLQPLAIFTLTVPLAFVSTTATLLSWALAAPLVGTVLGRVAPPDAIRSD